MLGCNCIRAQRGLRFVSTLAEQSTKRSLPLTRAPRFHAPMAYCKLVGLNEIRTFKSAAEFRAAMIERGYIPSGIRDGYPTYRELYGPFAGSAEPRYETPEAYRFYST